MQCTCLQDMYRLQVYPRPPATLALLACCWLCLWHAMQGLKVAVIEGHDIGGTCVNRGCVPSKALLAASGRVRDMRNAMHLKAMGIQVGGGPPLPRTARIPTTTLRCMQFCVIDKASSIGDQRVRCRHTHASVSVPPPHCCKGAARPAPHPLHPSPLLDRVSTPLALQQLHLPFCPPEHAPAPPMPMFMPVPRARALFAHTCTC